MSWNVKLTFTNTRMIIPDEDILLPTLPTEGMVLRVTPAFLERGKSNKWEDAITWQVKTVEVFLEDHNRAVALVTLVPFRGE